MYQKNTSLTFYPRRKLMLKISTFCISGVQLGNEHSVGKVIGMGFDGAATFSGDKTGVQRRLKEPLPHALFVHCRCHVLQRASMQAANATPDIKHVYTTLMMLWKFFHYSPTCRVIKGNSESNRSSRAQDCVTIRHTLVCTRALCQSCIS